MGNALRLLYAKCCNPTTTDERRGVSALARDLFTFETTSQVPEGLGKHVVSSKKAQQNWYGKLLVAWKETKPQPKTAEEAARFVIETLKRHKKADVEGFLAFYGFPLSQAPVEPSTEVPESKTDGRKFEIQTLPVDVKAVPDGDTITVYVSTDGQREASLVPRGVLDAAVERERAREKKNYAKADELHKKIIDSGYRMLNIQNKEVLARKYRIRLRGIDAPESKMPYGQEAKDVLAKMVEGKSLKVVVYAEDRYGRCVGDIFCNGKFVQEVMLKKGLAWHYTAYDKRADLAKWEQEARAKRVGLWGSSNPEKPWDWRKNKREGK